MGLTRQQCTGERRRSLGPVQQSLENLEIAARDLLHTFRRLFKKCEERLDKRQIRKCQIFIAAAVAHMEVTSKGNRSHLFQKSCLPNASLSFYENHLGTTGNCLLEIVG